MALGDMAQNQWPGSPSPTSPPGLILAAIHWDIVTDGPSAIITPQVRSENTLDCPSFFVVLGFELRVFTLSHSPSLIFVKGFSRQGSRELFAWAGLNCNPPE
jgi:hypothetical protein